MNANFYDPSSLNENRYSHKETLWRSRLVWLSIAGVVLLLALPLSIVWHEKRSAVQVDQELQRISRLGEPIDNLSLERWFRDRTYLEGTQQWGEILSVLTGSLLGYPDFERLPIQGQGNLLEPLIPGGPWPDEPVVADYLDYSRPLIDRIENAAEYPTPVWRPIEFQGFGTLLPELQASRSISRLLSLEAEHAIYHQDSERALRAIRLLGTTADAFDWDFCLVAVFVHHALRGIQLETIQRSLSANVWSVEQLDELVELLGAPKDIPKSFRDVMAAERAMFTMSFSKADYRSDSQELGELFYYIYQLPSTKLKLLDAWSELQGLADGDPGRVVKRAAQFENDLQLELERRPFIPGNVAVGLLIPAIQSSISALVRYEDFRRFTRTALAIKQYQLQFDLWPQRLSELERVGLTASDWNTQLSGPFGYDLVDGQPILWTYRGSLPPEQTTISDVIQLDSETEGQHHIVRIR